MRGRIDKSPLPRTIVTIRRLIIGPRQRRRRPASLVTFDEAELALFCPQDKTPAHAPSRKIWPTVLRNQSKPDYSELSKIELSV